MCDVLPEDVKPQNVLVEAYVYVERRGSGSRRIKAWAPILCCEAEIKAERADYILVTPFFVPVSCRIISEVLLDQHTCYLAPLSCSCKQTGLFHASGALRGFNCITTHMIGTCAHTVTKMHLSNSVSMASFWVTCVGLHLLLWF